MKSTTRSVSVKFALSIFILVSLFLLVTGCASNIKVPESTQIETPIKSLFLSTPEPPSQDSTLSIKPIFFQNSSPTPTIGLPTSIPQPVLPSEYLIPFKSHQQQFSIDCEASAAIDWAAYYGIALGEYEFQSKIPVSDNPDYGFVGNINSPWGQIPPFAYGVYAEPIANLLDTYGVPALAVKNSSLNLIKDQISSNNPVMVWIIGSMEVSRPVFFTDRLGRTAIVAPYEHVVILNGYDDTTQQIHYMSEGKPRQIPYLKFLNSWKILGNMAVVRQ